MKHESEEILTAMLDGQLSAEQESQLRSRLRSEAGWRELFEQLQAQRELLKQLPRIKASEDFASRVSAELLERRVEVSLPPEEGNSLLRGSWQSAAMIAASLAAILLVAIFLWPRSIATDSPQVARFENTEPIRKQEARERASLDQEQMVETRPIQRAPSGPLPQPAELADAMSADAAKVPGGEVAGESAPNSGRFAEPAGQKPLAQAAPGGLAAAAGVDEGGGAGNSGLNMPGVRSDASPELAVDGDRGAEPMARRTRSAPPAAAPAAEALEEKAALAGDEGTGLSPGALAGVMAKELPESGAVEVWFVEAGSVPAPAFESAEAGKSLAANNCELFLAEITAEQLPDWLSQLKAEATITQLDGRESGELLGQQGEVPLGQAENRPMSTAGIAGDGPAQERSRSSAEQEAKSSDSAAGAAAAPQVAVNFLGVKPADKIEQLLVRSQQRQQAGQQSAQQFAQGIGGGGGAKKMKRDGADARPAAEGYLAQLRSEADRQSKPAQSSGASSVPGGAGKRIVIVVRGK